MSKINKPGMQNCMNGHASKDELLESLKESLLTGYERGTMVRDKKVIEDTMTLGPQIIGELGMSPNRLLKKVGEKHGCCAQGVKYILVKHGIVSRRTCSKDLKELFNPKQ